MKTCINDTCTRVVLLSKAFRGSCCLVCWINPYEENHSVDCDRRNNSPHKELTTEEEFRYIEMGAEKMETEQVVEPELADWEKELIEGGKESSEQ